MTVNIITADNYAVNYTLAPSNSTMWVMPGVTLSNYLSLIPHISVVRLQGFEASMTSHGTILAAHAGPGIELVGLGTKVTFGTSSIYLSAAIVGTPSIIVQNGSATITNHGLISASEAVAIVAVGGQNAIYNDGRIEGGSGGLFLGANGSAGDRLVNDGTILAGNAQLAVFSERFNHAVQIEGNGTVLINHGTLAALATLGAGVNIGANGLTGAGSRVENYGSITSALWLGVDMAYLVNAGATLFNHGLISGGTGGVRGSIFADVVTNSGTVRGNIDLGQGDDLYDGRGGVVFGQINGYWGNDTMIGGAQDDDLFGDVGNDLMRGGAGDDKIDGSSGNDTVLGGQGDDTIVGGAGRDVMTGGGGADVFQFVTAAAIGNSVATRDVIRDFTTGLDLIDLATLPGTLTFIGAAAFSNVANQLRYTAATGLLEGDTNGNSTADFTLFLGAGTVLAAGDLIL